MQLPSLLCISFVYLNSIRSFLCGENHAAAHFLTSEFKRRDLVSLKQKPSKSSMPQGGGQRDWDSTCLLGQWVVGCTHLSPAGGFPAVFQEWPRRGLMTPEEAFSLRESLILWPFSLCPFLLSHRCPSFNLHQAVLFSSKTQLKWLLGLHLTLERDAF